MHFALTGDLNIPYPEHIASIIFHCRIRERAEFLSRQPRGRAVGITDPAPLRAWVTGPLVVLPR